MATSITNTADKARPSLDKFLKHTNPVRRSTAIIISFQGIDFFYRVFLILSFAFSFLVCSCFILVFDQFAELFCSFPFLLLLLNELTWHNWIALRSESSTLTSRLAKL